MKSQIVGNVGLYQVCAELSRLGFNVMPTARNAKGIDIVGYDEHGKAFTVQVKTLTKRNTIPLTSNGSHLMADYFIVLILEGKYSGTYIWTREEMQNIDISVFPGKDGKKHHWFQSKFWTKDLTSRNAWPKIVP